MSTRVSRVVRGLLVAVVALLVAAVAHIAGGGQVGAVGLTLALAFSALASIALAGRTVSTVRVSIAVVFSQGIFHVLFGIGAGHPLVSPTNSPGMMMGDPGATALPVTSAAITGSGWMWAAHVLAAVVTIWALVKGERTFWALSGWVSHSLTRLLEPSIPVSIDHSTMPNVAMRVRAPGARFLRAGMRHRGPPVVSASM